MESNIIKIFIKKFWKRCVTLPLNSLQRGMTLPSWHSLSLMTLPSEALALPPPLLQEKTYLLFSSLSCLLLLKNEIPNNKRAFYETIVK